jgi:hypothetical protein
VELVYQVVRDKNPVQRAVPVLHVAAAWLALEVRDEISHAPWDDGGIDSHLTMKAIK